MSENQNPKPVKLRLTFTITEEYEVTPGKSGYESCKTAQEAAVLDQTTCTEDPMTYVDNALAGGLYSVKVEVVEGGQS